MNHTISAREIIDGIGNIDHEVDFLVFNPKTAQVYKISINDAIAMIVKELP